MRRNETGGKAPGALTILAAGGVVAAGLLVASCGAHGDTRSERASAAAEAGPADLILVGRVRTLADASVAEAVAVRDGRVAGVGSRAHMEALLGPDTRTVHLEGAAVVPAFVDHHVHLLNVGLSLLNEGESGRLHLDLSGVSSLAEVASRVRGRADSLPAGAWVLGKGWSQAAWGTEALPDDSALTAAVPDRPVLLARVDGHAGWTNRAGLETAGLGHGEREGPAVPAGGAVVRDADGRPSGVLLERAVEPVIARIPPPRDADVMAAFRLATEALAARGVVEVFDAGFLAPPGLVALTADLEHYVRLLVRADSLEPLPVDVNLMVPAPSALAETVLARPERYRRLSPRVRVTHLKLFGDGALGSRGAALTHPYADDPTTTGVPRMPTDSILAWSRLALDAGLDVATHAIGDEAVRRALDAYEAVLRERPGLDPRRLRIEHFSYAREEDFGRAVDLGIVLSIQSNFNSPADLQPSFAARRVGAERQERVYAWRRLNRMGARLAEGSDWFALPGPALQNLHAALTARNALGSFGEGPAGRLEAVRLQARRFPPGGGPPEDAPLEPGDPADLAILSADPLTAPLDSLRDVRVLATYRAGRAVHGAAGTPLPPER